MSEARGDSTRVVVVIKRVWLAVRFNCKLSFILRNELSEKIAETDSTFALSRGECVVNEVLSVELPQEILGTRARKLKLVVMMISANGMVPAGFVTFPTQPRHPNEQFEAVLPLQRCEDTRAQIKFMHLYEHCGRTPFQQSFLHQLRPTLSPSKHPSLSSHSLGRDSIRKQRPEGRSPQQNVFAKPLISPRLLPRVPQQPQVTTFDRITEERENESSLNPLNHDQLLKEHQQYWLEIVRMEEEMEELKEEGSRLREEGSRLREENTSLRGENGTLRRDSQAMKEYYQGHQEKTHALLGQVQQNGETMRRLEAQLAEYRTIVAQKDQLQREFQKVMEIQSAEFRQSLNKLADQEERLRVALAEKQAAAMRMETLEETVVFLQRETKKQADGNLLLREKVAEDEDRIYFLANSNDTQKNIILELEAKLAHLSRENTALSALQEAHFALTKETELLKEENARKGEILAGLEREHCESREMLMLQSSLKEEEALLAHSKHAQSAQGLQTLTNAHQELRQTHEALRKDHEALLSASGAEQSKLKIFQREVQLLGREKEGLLSQLRRKTEEGEEARGQLHNMEEHGKLLSLKLIEQEASLAGRTATIQQLKGALGHAEQERDELLNKNLALQRQFQEMGLLLSREVDGKNQLTILLTTLEENYRSLEDEKSYLSSTRDELLRRNAALHTQLDAITATTQDAQRTHQEELEGVKAELSISQQQLGEAIEKTSVMEMELESTLGKLAQTPLRSSRDQYQESYNQSMTALTLRNAKLEKELEEASRQLQGEREAIVVLRGQITAKEAELGEVKAFTHTKLQENLRFMKENAELKTKQTEESEGIRRLQELINSKEVEVVRLERANEGLGRTNRESLQKIEQLSSELQFVTEVLQRERQEKSDIEKEIDHLESGFDHLEKGELPHIHEVAHLKEDSVEDTGHDEGSLEIESKFALSPGEERQKNGKQ